MMLQPQRYSLIEEKYAISNKTAHKIIQSFRNNKEQYNAPRGQINTQAAGAGVRLNIRFSETYLGKLEIDIADKSIPNTIELADEFSKIFSDSSNIKTHFKTICKMLKSILKSDSQGGVKTVIVGPEEQYATKVREALLDIIEARELARIK